MTLLRRVVARYLVGMEHASPEALKKYLAAHPKADRRNHQVRRTPSKPDVKVQPVPGSERQAEPDEASKKTKPSDGGSSISVAHRSKTELSGLFKPSAEVLAETVASHKAKFEAFDKEETRAAESFKTKYSPNEYVDDKTDRMTPAFAKLPLAEKLIHVGGHKLGQHFESTLSKAETKMHGRYFERWRTSAGSYDQEGMGRAEDFDHSSQELQGLASSLGVSGQGAPADDAADKETNGDVVKARRKGAKDSKLQAYAKKMYDYQQAYFKHAGLKELTLYRGINGTDVDDTSEGTDVSVNSRELASFTADPNVAKGFGRVIAFKIPVERVFASSLVRPGIGSETHGSAGSSSSFGEAEFLIMGASDLVGQAMFDPVVRTAGKKKPMVVPISNENADWLHPPRKKPTKKHKSKTEHEKQALVSFARRDVHIAQRVAARIIQGSEQSRWEAAAAELAKFNTLYAPVQKKPRDENVLRKCIMGASKMLKIRLWSSKCLEADIDAELLAASREVYALAKNKTASVDSLSAGIEHFKVAAQRAVESAAPEEFSYQGFKVINRQRFSDQACRQVLAGVDYLVGLFKKRGVVKVIGTGVARIVLVLEDDANGGATASFDSRTRELILGVSELLKGHAARILDDFTNETILHEFGHYVHRIYLTGEAREAWNEPWGDLPSLANSHKVQPKNRQQRIDPLEIVTEYGQVDQFEDFAETFVVFMAAPEKLTRTSKFRMQRALSLTGLYGKPVMRLSNVVLPPGEWKASAFRS